MNIPPHNVRLLDISWVEKIITGTLAHEMREIRLYGLAKKQGVLEQYIENAKSVAKNYYTDLQKEMTEDGSSQNVLEKLYLDWRDHASIPKGLKLTAETAAIALAPEGKEFHFTADGKQQTISGNALKKLYENVLRAAAINALCESLNINIHSIPNTEIRFANTSPVQTISAKDLPDSAIRNLLQYSIETFIQELPFPKGEANSYNMDNISQNANMGVFPFYLLSVRKNSLKPLLNHWQTKKNSTNEKLLSPEALKLAATIDRLAKTDRSIVIEEGNGQTREVDLEEITQNVTSAISLNAMEILFRFLGVDPEKELAKGLAK